VSPNLLVDPSLNELETSAAVPDSKVVHPPGDHGVDGPDDLPHGMGAELSDDNLELLEQRRAGLQSWPEPCGPDSPTTPLSTKLKAQESEALSLRQVNNATLLLIHLDLDLGQFFPKALVYRLSQPLMAGAAPQEDDEIIREPCVLQLGVLAQTSDRPSFLQHPVHLVEVDVRKER